MVTWRIILPHRKMPSNQTGVGNTIVSVVDEWMEGLRAIVTTAMEKHPNTNKTYSYLQDHSWLQSPIINHHG
jgi:hypothetical protein